MDASATKVPGTVQLIEAELASDRHGEIVLIPTPSANPEDPLNWPFWRKALSTSCIVIYTLMVCLAVTAVYSVTRPISAETELSVDNLITGLGIMFLFGGWGCIPWQALALQYGKRPAYLMSLAGNVILLAVAPLCRTWPTYLANKILHGIFSAPVESLCEISVTDVWFAHERPRYLAFYGFALSFASKLAPSLAGFINYGQNWQWTLYWCAIWQGIAFVYCFFLMEETNFDRPSHNEDARDSESIDNEDKISASEKKPETSKPQSTSSQDVEEGSAYPRKTYWQKLSLWPESRPNRILRVMWSPFRFFKYPVVVYAGLMYGANGVVWSSIMNATAGTLLPQQYGFSTAGIAYAYLSAAIGATIGSVYCGKIGEMLVVRLAKRNNGYSEPEHVLWIFLASWIFVPFSVILWGVGAAYNIHWFALVFAMGTLAISNAIACPMALAYAISSYRELSGELVTTTILIRNTMVFAINYGIGPWQRAQGLRDCFITAGVIGFVFNSSMFVFIKYGKKLREMSAPMYWAAVEKAKAEGSSH